MLSFEKKRILIIGAGPSGMTAALSAAREGCACFVVEHNDTAGKKLALTGNGRCNYTNTDVSPAHYHQGSGNGSFIKKLLEIFSYEDCVSFFEEIGIEPEIIRYRFDDHGYVYPKGESAAAFRDTLYRACLESGVFF
jgi:predicted flavoprotein YhiN